MNEGIDDVKRRFDQLFDRRRREIAGKSEAQVREIDWAIYRYRDVMELRDRRHNEALKRRDLVDASMYLDRLEMALDGIEYGGQEAYEYLQRKRASRAG